MSFYRDLQPLNPPKPVPTSMTPLRTSGVGRSSVRVWVALHIGDVAEMRWLAVNMLRVAGYGLGLLVLVAIMYVLLGAK